MSLLIVIDIDGDVDQSSLDRLRKHLTLDRRGRLTDDWDQDFGHRVVAVPGGPRLNIGLYREFDGSWLIQVQTRETSVSDDEIAKLREELVASITAAGFDAAVRAKPTFGGREKGTYE